MSQLRCLGMPALLSPLGDKLGVLIVDVGPATVDLPFVLEIFLEEELLVEIADKLCLVHLPRLVDLLCPLLARLRPCPQRALTAEARKKESNGSPGRLIVVCVLSPFTITVAKTLRLRGGGGGR